MLHLWTPIFFGSDGPDSIGSKVSHILRLGRPLRGPDCPKWPFLDPKMLYFWPKIIFFVASLKKCCNHDGTPKRQPFCVGFAALFSLHSVEKINNLQKKKWIRRPHLSFFLLSHLTPYCSASSFSYICCCYEDSSHRWIFRNMIIISSFNLSKDNQIFSVLRHQKT